MEHLLHAQAAGSTAMPDASPMHVIAHAYTSLQHETDSVSLKLHRPHATALKDTEGMQCSADQQRGDGLAAVTVLPASAA